MSLMDSLLACCFAVNTSNMLLIVVSMMLFGWLLVMMNIFLQSCILSMLGVLLLFIGSACMLTDALGKSGRYLYVEANCPQFLLLILSPKLPTSLL